MRIVFFGTGEFSVPSLKKLFSSGHDICAVVTQPDRKKGRGWKVRPGHVKSVVEHVMPGVKILQPEDTSGKDFIAALRSCRADIFTVIDYGRILSADILGLPERYCINLHPSLLPEYRGAAPVNRALLDGRKVTGNTVIKMNDRMDAGAVIAREQVDIYDDEDAVNLSERLSVMGAELLIDTIDIIESGGETFTEQDEGNATYAHKLKKSDGEILWKKGAVHIINLIRALTPWPGAFTFLNGKMLKVKKASICNMSTHGVFPGTILDPVKFIISSGKDAIRIEQLQLEGKKVMAAEEFLRGHTLNNGDILGN